jgi:Tfp pilus assembly PilM family ATPase
MHVRPPQGLSASARTAFARINATPADAAGRIEVQLGSSTPDAAWTEVLRTLAEAGLDVDVVDVDQRRLRANVGAPVRRFRG